MRNLSSLIVTRTITPAVDSSIMWDRHTLHSPEEQKLQTTECQDRDSHKSSDKDHNRNCEREREKSKKSDNWHSSDQPCRCSPRHKDHDGTCEHGANGKCMRSHTCDSQYDSRKTKQRCKVSASLPHGCKKSCTLEHRPLPPLPMFHSTPKATPHRLSSDPTSAHLSFDQSQGSLPPVNLGGGKPCPISSMSAPIPAGIPSVLGPIPLSSKLVSALRLMVDHTKEIFNLACEGCQLKERFTREFAKLPGSVHRLWNVNKRVSGPFYSILCDIAVWPGIFGSKRQGYRRTPS